MGLVGDVELRAWTVADAAWYAQCTKDTEVQRFTTDGPDVTEEVVAKAIAELAEHPKRDAFLIADARTGERYGNVALDVEDGIGDVSYLVAAEARGKGVAGLALTLFADWIFANRDVRELRLWTHADNLPSRKVAERAGFVRDPGRDREREIKGELWPTVAYRLPRDR